MGGVYNKGVNLNRRERNIAMFGGSFNPPHNAHVELALRMREEFSLERVLFVVASDPPHKSIDGGVDANTRLALTKAALRDVDGLEACDVELRRRGKSYTADTLRELARRYPEARLWLVVGEDMLENMPHWREPEAIFALATVAAASRPGALEDIRRTAAGLRARYGADVRISAFGEEDVSSTAIRARVFDARPVSRLVPPGTEELIWELSLYQPAEIRLAQTKLRASLNPERYRHSVGTMRCAVELAERFGFDGKKARLAGLLHDCAKLPHDQILALAARYAIVPDAYDRANPGLLHDRVGARYAREAYGVSDAEILSAIAGHTRLEKGMSAFSRMIYLADKIEHTRDYPGVEAIREAARTDMDRAALLCMENVLAHLRDKGCDVQPNIYEAIEELNRIIRSKEERH
ncbi:MAG: Nicotinate-nucleotide adenylyltransferase [Firmicutes bacterium ADurb.Bin248]|nr:MAG: Nicotinate-nucleotide adenylyltransferase [Firmicutes bacterium ADurb.Bin248]